MLRFNLGLLLEFYLLGLLFFLKFRQNELDCLVILLKQVFDSEAVLSQEGAEEFSVPVAKAENLLGGGFRRGLLLSVVGARSSDLV